ncbi:hypothetical protein ANCDUO_12725 [Ancylostoma duodenale]|uniref:Serpin domain-containing protein n=1 Tax=Ancylostoma duodenale TaxID=51022 RepID=A0A0C2CKQ2_9BILA|nr:hypothetical protein ANCDUO_12725 [Ancylostoma duodenale]
MPCSNLGESDDRIMTYYSNLSQQILKPRDGVQTRIANGFFLDNQYEIEDHYKDTVTKYYSAKVEYYDFGKPDEAAEIVQQRILRARWSVMVSTVDVDETD